MERLYYQESAAKKERKLETECKSFFIIGGVNEFYGDWSRLWSRR